MAVVEGTVTKLDPEIAASLTAEATLKIATPTSPDEANLAVENELHLRGLPACCGIDSGGRSLLIGSPSEPSR